jgi:HPt (histidine-containing phosphotransfer) domain-containing protein
VKSTERAQSDGPAPPVLDDPLALDEALEVVRQSFCARLHDEKARLAALAIALRSCETDSAPVLEELELFAHRLRGAAAVFEALELSQAAKALELAAEAGRAQHSEAPVWSALNLLANELASLTGSEPSPTASGAPPGTSHFNL